MTYYYFHFFISSVCSRNIAESLDEKSKCLMSWNVKSVTTALKVLPGSTLHFQTAL